ncbi:MAG: hypothetical protein LAO07_17490, partial [Acidobacteriia bacterium]|nr:hypothetical protein [Terriglobia bacterium]
QMPGAEHYFGLGDKTGQFDRREQAYTLWNTDIGPQGGWGLGKEPQHPAPSVENHRRRFNRAHGEDLHQHPLRGAVGVRARTAGAARIGWRAAGAPRGHRCHRHGRAAGRGFGGGIRPARRAGGLHSGHQGGSGVSHAAAHGKPLVAAA